jgi:glycerophosphoryl diester phosphodiesterase
VLPFGFADENAALPYELRRGDDPAGYGDAATEYRLAGDVDVDVDVDGVYTDHPDTALDAFGA